MKPAPTQTALLSLSIVLAFCVAFGFLYLVLGSKVISNPGIWGPMASFFLFLLAVSWILKLAVGKPSANHPVSDGWEVERLNGKWRYVLGLSVPISAVAITVLLAVYFAFASERKEGVESLVALLLLIVIALGAAFLVPLEMWKSKERYFRRHRSRDAGARTSDE